MSDDNLPDGFTESFYGFEMTDEQVGEGPYQAIALELKHVFESLAREAAKGNEEMFLSGQLQEALAEFFWRPTLPTLTHILDVSPSLHASIVEIARLVTPSLLKQIPDIA